MLLLFVGKPVNLNLKLEGILSCLSIQALEPPASWKTGKREEAKHGMILDKHALAKSCIHEAVTAKGTITIWNGNPAPTPAWM